MSESERPERLSILDELGRKKSLEPDAFLPLTQDRSQNSSKDQSSNLLILLGIGPDPLLLAEKIQKEAKERKIYWVECPDFEKQMPPTWAVPKEWTRLTREQALQMLTQQEPLVWAYRPAMGFFSSFWGSLIGVIDAKSLNSPDFFQTKKEISGQVILPGGESDLLIPELENACRENGLTPVRIPPDSPSHKVKQILDFSEKNSTNANLATILQQYRPALFLSVNFRGLDPEGRRFRLLQVCGVPVAVWCVDNPWHQLSALRLPWWKEVALFVTDASFLPQLRQHGVAFVRHLPLGAWAPSHIVGKKQQLHPLVFVGRSAFPDRNQFFAGCRLPDPLLREAKIRVHSADMSNQPNVHWWEEHLGLKQYWPGMAIRQAGMGAELCSMFRRMHWLNAASPLGLTVFGDENWKNLLPKSDVRPAVDYYHGLFPLYAQARYSLNITSLLLPSGLTQRHFDVWMAGGCLLTDATPGLRIFPAELTKIISLERPNDLQKRIEFFEKDRTLRQDISTAWQECLRSQHSYGLRIATLLHELKKYP